MTRRCADALTPALRPATRLLSPCTHFSLSISLSFDIGTLRLAIATSFGGEDPCSVPRVDSAPVPPDEPDRVAWNR